MRARYHFQIDEVLCVYSMRIMRVKGTQLVALIQPD